MEHGTNKFLCSISYLNLICRWIVLRKGRKYTMQRKNERKIIRISFSPRYLEARG